MISVKSTPDTPIRSTDPASHILNGRGQGPSIIHKVGSAKQYATKGTGRVCNQAKFPMRKKG